MGLLIFSFLSCSVNCFKIHKTAQCDEIKSQRESQNRVLQFTEDREPQRMIFETVDTVPVSKLEQLNNPAIKELLRNKHLRDLLKELNEARNPWKAMRVAMTEPLFVEFADECIKVVDQEDRLL